MTHKKNRRRTTTSHAEPAGGGGRVTPRAAQAPNGGTVVPGLTRTEVTSTEEVRALALTTTRAALRRRLLRSGGRVVRPILRCATPSLRQVLALMTRGGKNRACAGTDMNADSSRSHSVLSVEVTGLNVLARVQVSDITRHVFDRRARDTIERSRGAICLARVQARLATATRRPSTHVASSRRRVAFAVAVARRVASLFDFWGFRHAID
jgi:hypothetical protein